MSSSSGWPEKFGDQYAAAANESGSMPTSVSCVSAVGSVRTNGIVKTFVECRPKPASGAKIGPFVSPTTSAPVEPSTLSRVDSRIVTTAVPAYASTPIASVEAVTSSSATRGAVETRREARYTGTGHDPLPRSSNSARPNARTTRPAHPAMNSTGKSSSRRSTWTWPPTDETADVPRVEISYSAAAARTSSGISHHTAGPRLRPVASTVSCA